MAPVSNRELVALFATADSVIDMVSQDGNFHRPTRTTRNPERFGYSASYDQLTEVIIDSSSEPKAPRTPKRSSTRSKSTNITPTTSPKRKTGGTRVVGPTKRSKLTVSSKPAAKSLTAMKREGSTSRDPRPIKRVKMAKPKAIDESKIAATSAIGDDSNHMTKRSKSQYQLSVPIKVSKSVKASATSQSGLRPKPFGQTPVHAEARLHRLPSLQDLAKREYRAARHFVRHCRIIVPSKAQRTVLKGSLLHFCWQRTVANVLI
jgi:hypothetical protein